MRLYTIVGSYVASVCLAASAMADVTWQNTGTDWNSAGNWAGGVPTGADVAIFDAATPAAQPDLSADGVARGIDFQTAGWTLSSGTGNKVAVGDGGIDSAGAGSCGVTANIEVTASQTWTVAADTELHLRDKTTSTSGAAGITVTKDGPGLLVLRKDGTNWLGDLKLLAGEVVVDKPDISGGGAQNPLGMGTVTLGDAAAPTVPLRITSTGDYIASFANDAFLDGDLIIDGPTIPNTVPGISGGGISLNGTTTLNRTVTVTVNSHGGSIADYLQFDGVVQGNFGFIKKGDASLSFEGESNTFTGGVILLEGTLEYDNGGSHFGIGGTLVIGDAANPDTTAADAVRVATNRGSGAKNITSLAGITVDANFQLGGLGGAYERFVAAIPWTLTGNRTVFLADNDDPIIQGSIGDGGNGYGLRIEPSAAFATRRLELEGANTFSGAVELAPGAILVLDDPDALADSVIVRLEMGNDGSSDVFGQLNMLDPVTVDQLYLNGVAQPVGTYGAGGSGAMFPSDDYFLGTQVLTVLTQVPEPATMGLLALGALGLGALRRRRK